MIFHLETTAQVLVFDFVEIAAAPSTREEYRMGETEHRADCLGFFCMYRLVCEFYEDLISYCDHLTKVCTYGCSGANLLAPYYHVPGETQGPAIEEIFARRQLRRRMTIKSSSITRARR